LGFQKAIWYTSGTTGFPKGAELSHSNIMMNSLCCHDLLQLSRDDIHILVLPLFHSFGQTVQMNAGISMGNTMVLIPRFTPEAVLEVMISEKSTVFAGVPAMSWALLNYADPDDKYDLDQIVTTPRLGVSGGSSMPVEIIKGIEGRNRCKQLIIFVSVNTTK
jgi:long-chain acyl-CoA synthetase